MRKLFYYFLFPLVLSIPQNMYAQINGYWEGNIQSPGGAITLSLEISTNPLKGYLSSSMGLQKMPIEELSFANNTLKFKLTAFQVSYTGSLKADQIIGEWQQGPQKVNLSFTKKQQSNSTRSQTPKKGESYESSEVQFSGTPPSPVLAGTLNIPKGAGPFPAVILLSVAGPNDRNQSHSNGHQPFLVIADYLSKRGFAVLRYDDRGVGSSQGNLYNSTLEDFKKDALGAVELLKKHPKIDPQKMGFIGNSEGTVVATMCAVEHPDIAFVIQLGAVGVPLADLTPDRLEKMQAMHQLKQEQKSEIIRYSKQVATIIVQNASRSEKQKALQAIQAKETFDKPGFPNQLFFMPASREERIQLFLSPWYASQVQYHPQSWLPRLKTPALIINGSLDVFQSPARNFPSIQQYLLEAGNEDFCLMVAPKVNHVMQLAQTGFPTEYGLLENTVAPVILETIHDWLERRLLKKEVDE